MSDMTEEMAQNNEEEKNSGDKSGNLFSRYGKIFLITTMVLVQAGAAYMVINSYYGDIYNWMEGLGSNETVQYAFEDIIINPANSRGNSYLIITVVAEMNAQSDLGMLKGQEAKVIDQINLILSKKTTGELTQSEIRTKLKQEIEAMINKTLKKKAVRNLFFTKYVLQY